MSLNKEKGPSRITGQAVMGEAPVDIHVIPDSRKIV